MSRLISTFAAVLVAVGIPSLTHAARPATQPASAPTTGKAISEIAEKFARAAELTEEFKARPSIGRKTWPDVLGLDYEGIGLVARSSLPQSNGPQSFTIDGADGLLSGYLRLNKAGQPLMLRIDRLRTNAPNAIYVNTTLHTVPGHIILSMDREWAGGSVSVQFLDDRQNPDRTGPHPEGEVRLYVTGSDANDEPAMDLTLITADLPTLVKEHPREVNAYLRPALREINQEALINPSAALAAQVLGGGAPSTRGVSDEKVKTLVGQLDADDARDRQAAAQELKKLGEAGAAVLARINREKLTPEQVSRLDDILSGFHPVSKEEGERLAHDKSFLIDCLELGDLGLRRLAAEQLKKETGGSLAFQPDAALPTRIEAIDALRQHLLAPPATRALKPLPATTFPVKPPQRPAAASSPG